METTHKTNQGESKVGGLRSVTQAAEFLGVSPKLVYKLVAERRIPFTRVGRLVRFTPEHLDSYIAERTVGVVR